MHTRRLASLLLGAWLAGSLFMMAVATTNFRVVDRLLQSPAKAARLQIDALTEEGARMFWRYLSSEINRSLFGGWEWVQLALGLGLVITLVFATNGNKMVIGLGLAMVAMVAAMHWLMTPEITVLGRLIDYVAPNLPTEERLEFWRYHRVYTAMELVKLLTGLGLGVWLLMDSRDRDRSRQRRRRSRGKDLEEVQVVDDADNGHVDR